MTRHESLEAELKAIMEDVPPHHGWEHAEEVSRFSRLLAFLEEANLDSAKFSGLLHDLRKRDDEELKVRKIRVSWGEKGEATDARTLVRRYRHEIVLGTEESFWKAFATYRDILEAVRVSEKGDLPNPQKPVRKSAQILRDADRLSRAGIKGLKSILETNRDYKEVPFYIDGREIIRAKDAPLIPFNQINSCIDDVNCCTGDWEKIMETEEGRSLMPILDRTNHQFLAVFDRNREIKDYNIWIGWLDFILASQRLERQRINLLIDSGEYVAFLLGRIFVDDPSLLSEESFSNYLASQGNSLTE